MDVLLSGRFKSFGCVSSGGVGECDVLLLDDDVDAIAPLVRLLESCYQRGVKLLLPVESSRIIPLISAGYDVSIAPLRTVVRSTNTEVTPLPFTLTPSSSGPLRFLDSAAVSAVLMQHDPLCSLMKPSDESTLEKGAVWLGLFGYRGGSNAVTVFEKREEYDDDVKASGSGDILQVAVGISRCGQVWIYRDTMYLDWKKISAVFEATLRLASSNPTFSSDMVCVLPVSDEVCAQAVLSANCGFVQYSSTSHEVKQKPNCSVEYTNLADINFIGSKPPQEECYCMDCIIFHERISNKLYLNTDLDGSCQFSSPTLLFLLAGQSNMSGRGRLSDLVRESSLEDVRSLHGCSDDKQESPFIVSSVVVEQGQESQDVLLSDEYSNKIKALDVENFAWTNLHPMKLHSSVDYARDARFGPGVTFATRLVELLDLERKGREKEVVGLVPAAVGATFLEEWAPNFRCRDSKGLPKCNKLCGEPNNKNSILMTVPDNAKYQPLSHKGCFNLLSCAMRSFYGALLKASLKLIGKQMVAEDILKAIRSQVGGLIWSQGCNDSISVPESLEGTLHYLGRTAADTYQDRQSAFMHFVRWCFEGIVALVHQHMISMKFCESAVGECLEEKSVFRAKVLSWPPIVMVAVTGTRPWMVYLQDIRRQQLAAASQIPNLITVDSLGSFLKNDCVHITTAASLSLGYLLASAMAHLLHGGEKEHPARQDQLNFTVSRAATPQDLSLYRLFCRARSTCERALNNYYNNMTKNDRLKNKKKYPIFESGINPQNFVYGEIDFLNLMMILRYIDKHRARYAEENYLVTKADSAIREQETKLKCLSRTFADLGCGAGVACAAAALSGSFTEVLGIELMVSKLEACRCMMYCLGMQITDKNLEVGHLLSAASAEDCFFNVQSKTDDNVASVKVSMKEGNFLDAAVPSNNWECWDVVYIATTMFTPDQMIEIHDRVTSMPQNSYLILLDKQLPNTTDNDDITKITYDCFELAMSCQSQSTWGSTMVYVYHKFG